MSDSYYKTIDGKHYDREMLEIADEAVAGVGDGRISVEDAQKLLGAVKDANKYTDIEKATMKYIRENYKFTYAADQWFRTEIRKWAATKVKENDENPKPTDRARPNEFVPSKSYYIIIDGEHYVRSLLEAADVRLEGKGEGLISEEDFQQIIELSRDGKGITETEMRTLEYISLKYNLTTKAGLWFKEHLEQLRSEVIKSKKSSEKKLSQAINEEEEKVLIKLDWEIMDGQRASLTYQNTDGNTISSTGASSSKPPSSAARATCTARRSTTSSSTGAAARARRWRRRVAVQTAAVATRLDTATT